MTMIVKCLAPPQGFLIELRPAPGRVDPDSQAQMLRALRWSQRHHTPSSFQCAPGAPLLKRTWKCQPVSTTHIE